ERGIIGGRAQHHGLGREPRARAQQPVQLAARLQILVTSQRGDHLLTHLVVAAGCGGSRRFANRRVRPRSCGESTWRRLRMLVRTQSRDSSEKFKKIPTKRGTTFSRQRPRGTNKINSFMSRAPARSVEDG